MNPINFIVIILIFIIGCKGGSDNSYTINEICECYENQQIQQIDKRLGECLNGLNKWLNSKNINFEEKETLGKEELFKVTKKLIASCSNYQTDFNTVLLSRYESRNEKIDKSKRDSTINRIKRGENSAVNKSILAEYEIIDGKYESAMNLVNESISENSSNEIAYWVRGFLYHRNGEIEKAIIDCDKLEKISKNLDMIHAIELWKTNLEKEKNKS